MTDLYGCLVFVALAGLCAGLVIALSKAHEAFDAERQRWETERAKLVTAALLPRPEVAAHVMAAKPAKAAPTPDEDAKRPRLPLGL